MIFLQISMLNEPYKVQWVAVGNSGWQLGASWEAVGAIVGRWGSWGAVGGSGWQCVAVGGSGAVDYTDLYAELRIFSQQ